MKRFFPIFLLFVLTLALILLPACSTKEEDSQLSISESLDTNYKALTRQLEHTEDFQAVSDYLSTWAHDNGIDVKTANHQYIILSRAASAGYEDAKNFTLQCSIILDDETEKEETLQVAAAVMTALYSAEHHGTLKAVFTLQAAGKAEGAAALGDHQLKGDHFIVLDYNRNDTLYNSVAASSEITASQDLTMAAPQYTKAYKLTLKGTANKSPYKYRSTYPNAIKIIGDLLASCQSSGVLFELSSFVGGEASDLYPSTASAVVVLQENDVESFTRRFDSSYERVEDYYDEAEEPFEYTMTEVKMPKRVISHNNTNHIVSLMYTLTNGPYLRSDNGDVKASSNIGKISTKKGKFKLNINARSLENNLMEEMNSVFQTTCGLCDIRYKEISSKPLWYASKKIPLIAALSENLKAAPEGIIEQKAADIFLQRKPELNLAVWGINLDSAEKDISVLLNYMESFGEIPEE